jgi:hypothetical protein
MEVVRCGASRLWFLSRCSRVFGVECCQDLIDSIVQHGELNFSLLRVVESHAQIFVHFATVDCHFSGPAVKESALVVIVKPIDELVSDLWVFVADFTVIHMEANGELFAGFDNFLLATHGS